MPIHRLTNNMSAGELSPLMWDRTDFKRRDNGCRLLENAQSLPQGGVTRRTGFKFIADLYDLGLKTVPVQVRQIPFIFNENQAYSLVFFNNNTGGNTMVIATGEGLVTSGGNVVKLNIPSSWNIDEMDYAQSADELYIAQSGVKPHIIKRLSHTNWQLIAVTFTDQPSDWSGTKGWPEVVTFHQQRLLFAANKLRRQTVWCSKAGDFSDFGTSSPSVDSDAITFTLDSGTQNKIVWMVSSKSLHIGTIGNEWTVVGGNRRALTPTNVLARRQTNRGSAKITPLMIGISTIFLERHGRTVNEFVYDYTYDSYTTTDVSILSPHVTEFHSIKQWSYQQTPDSIIWAIREDGTLLGITYQRQHSIIGWHRHTTQGDFLSVNCIPNKHSREDDVWAITRRLVNGVYHHMLEKKSPAFKPNNEAPGSYVSPNGFFVDNYVQFIDSSGYTSVSAPNLAGATVSIMVDGAVHPDKVVPASGIVQLDYPGKDVVIGLPYETVIEPLLQDLQNSKDGTSLGRVKRINKIVLSLYRSGGIFIGRRDDEDGLILEEHPFRRPSHLTGQAVPLFSGLYRINFMEGFDMDDTILIVQKQPLPLTVKSITDFVEVFE